MCIELGLIVTRWWCLNNLYDITIIVATFAAVVIGTRRVSRAAVAGHRWEWRAQRVIARLSVRHLVSQQT